MGFPVNIDDETKVYGWVRRMGAALGRCVLPWRCLLCGEAGGEGRDLCAACFQALPWNAHCCERCAIPLPVSGICGACLQRPLPLASIQAAFVYAFPLDRLVPRFKFHRDLAAGHVLAGLMAERLRDAPRPDALVPVPLHAQRLRQRGYDQALELARFLSRELGIPLQASLLQRQRDTSAQSLLHADARRRNLRGAFAMAARPVPAHVVLVDDVMTTGATLGEAAHVLRRAGVQRVDAWVCARTP